MAPARVAPGVELQPRSQSPLFGRLHDEHARRLERQRQRQADADAKRLSGKSGGGKAQDAPMHRGPALHFLLHAEHARQQERLQQMRSEVERAREEENSRLCCVRLASQEVAEQVGQRLYREAERKRQRQEERRQRCEYAEEMKMQLSAHAARGRTALDMAARQAGFGLESAGEDTPRFERLYAMASQKDLQLALRKQEAEREELKRLAAESVHRSAAEDGRFQDDMPRHERLYLDSQQRWLRREQLVNMAEEMTDRVLQEGSVHHRAANAMTAERRAELLYEEALQRKERQEELRREQERAGSESLVAGPEVVQQASERMYRTALEREEKMRERREYFWETQQKELQAASVHNRNERLPAQETAAIGARLHATRSVTPPRLRRQQDPPADAPTGKTSASGPRPGVVAAVDRTPRGGGWGRAPRFPSRRRLDQAEGTPRERDKSAPPRVRAPAPTSGSTSGSASDVHYEEAGSISTGTPRRVAGNATPRRGVTPPRHQAKQQPQQRPRPPSPPSAWKMSQMVEEGARMSCVAGYVA
eukprot:TRINITY_DN22143_c0_g1_i1.p1 TRINITY_DN22143_c0_g1~~TRINITY_DN22143_c0_g1_i1.p1  ORF type:complete len:536 (-),score=111.75 TRINITY_DN22143_c0_g1_i1:69-1676(-)